MKRTPIPTETDYYTSIRFNQPTALEREQAWHDRRATGVGGSDMSTLLGLNKYRTPYDLWLEKSGRQPHENIEDRWAIVKGNTLEPALRKRFRANHPEWQVTDGSRYSFQSVQHPCMLASLDGIIYDPETDSWGVLEIKTANANRGRLDWHDSTGNLTIPDYYMAQVTHYMAVTGWTWGYVYADIGEPEPVEIRFERDEDDINAVIQRAEEFWNYVLRDEMPALTGDDIAKAYPEPTEELADESEDDSLHELMRQYDVETTLSKQHSIAAENIRTQLIARIGKRQGITCQEYTATYKVQHRKGYTRTVAPSDIRTFHFSKPKN